MNKIVVELIDLLYKQLGGYATDCGGDLSEECKDNGCKFLGVCTRQYELSNALHNLKERASQSAELAATVPAVAAANKQIMPCLCLTCTRLSENGGSCVPNTNSYVTACGGYSVTA